MITCALESQIQALTHDTIPVVSAFDECIKPYDSFDLRIKLYAFLCNDTEIFHFGLKFRMLAGHNFCFRSKFMYVMMNSRLALYDNSFNVGFFLQTEDDIFRTFA